MNMDVLRLLGRNREFIKLGLPKDTYIIITSFYLAKTRRWLGVNLQQACSVDWRWPLARRRVDLCQHGRRACC